MPSFLPRIAAIALEADLDVDARRQRVQALQRVDGFRRRLEDVDQPLVGADLEVLAGVLVLERRADHAVDVFLGRQRHRTGDGGAGALGGLDDLFGSPIYGVVVIRLQSDPNFLCRDGCHFDASLVFLFALPRKEGGAPFYGAPPRSYVLAVVKPARRRGRGGWKPPLGVATRRSRRRLPSRRCGHPRGWRTADPGPWRSAGSARSSSRRYRPASPSRSPRGGWRSRSRRWSGSRTEAGSRRRTGCDDRPPPSSGSRPRL